ncbi:MAG TPA: hypothetical protein VIU11_13730, partial [Nakamurella sp.]
PAGLINAASNPANGRGFAEMISPTSPAAPVPSHQGRVNPWLGALAARDGSEIHMSSLLRLLGWISASPPTARRRRADL